MIPTYDPLQLVDLQARTLYRLDAADHLLTTNEPGDLTAPRLAISRTLVGDRWWFRHDLPPTLIADLDRLLATEPPPRDLREPPRCLDRLQALLTEHAPVARVYFGPAYYCPDTLAPSAAIPTARITDPAPLRDTFPDLIDELADRQPCRAVLDGGAAVAVCFCARLGADAAEAGAQTLATHRNRGYAAAAVAAWADAVRQLGRLPLYSTSWDNLASQGVARRLGLVLYGANLSIG